MSEPAIPSLFQVHGTSLGQDHISDRITNVNSHSILYYTEVVAGANVVVRLKAGMNMIAKAVENALAAINDAMQLSVSRLCFED